MNKELQQINKLVSSISAAMSSSVLYSCDHPSVVDNVGKVLELLKNLCVDGSLAISMGNDNLLVNGSPLTGTPEAKKFFLKLRQKGLQKIVLRKDAGPDELKKFVSDLASSAALSDSYTGILLTFSKEAYGDLSYSGQSAIGEISKIKEIFRDLSIYKTIDTSTIDAVIGSFIVAVRRDMDILKVLIPARAGKDLAFIHNANVAMLSIFQAEILGFGSDALHDIGFSALVHDIGKVLLPGCLGKQAAADPQEMLIVKKHPVYGASLLISLSKIPELAVIVAFEHHMKYDGTGYPETKHGKRQHIVSQIVAISDFFDTMRTELPNRKPLHVNAIAGFMREASGTEFNPLLVENLVRALKA